MVEAGEEAGDSPLTVNYYVIVNTPYQPSYYEIFRILWFLLHIPHAVRSRASEMPKIRYINIED